MISNPEPGYRRAALWVIKSIGNAEAVTMIRPLIRDPDPGVRRAAFSALGHLRNRVA